MNPIKQSDNLDQKQWFTQPDNGHLVQFYNDSLTLHNSLLEYFLTGLRNDEICLAVATPTLLANMENKLLANGINVLEYRKKGKFITLNAYDALDEFMIDGEPNKQLFNSSIGELIKELSSTGKPIRAFGEMVAILWKQGNADGVMKLEEFWNNLALTHNFSLFCAYPFMTFDATAHLKEINNIHRLHSHAYPIYSAFKSAAYQATLA